MAEAMMAAVTVELDDEVVGLMGKLDEPVDDLAKEMIVFGLYQRGVISRGKAAAILRMPMYDFIQRAARLGVPYFDLTPEELDAEFAMAESL